MVRDDRAGHVATVEELVTLAVTLEGVDQIAAAGRSCFGASEASAEVVEVAVDDVGNLVRLRLEAPSGLARTSLPFGLHQVATDLFDVSPNERVSRLHDLVVGIEPHRAAHIEWADRAGVGVEGGHVQLAEDVLTHLSALGSSKSCLVPDPVREERYPPQVLVEWSLRDLERELDIPQLVA